MSDGERIPLRRAFIIWLLVGLVTLLGTVATLAALAPLTYSASAFVERYFDGLAGGHVAELLRTPGVQLSDAALAELGVPTNTSRALLTSGVISNAPTDVTITADELGEAGEHVVTVSYSLAGTAHTARYVISPEPALFGVIPRWSFASSPLQLLSVTVQNGTHFSANDLTLDVRAATAGESTGVSQTGHYLAFAPAVYTLHYSSSLVTADPAPVAVLPDSENVATLAIQPTSALVERVQGKLDGFLADCVTQRVLQPAGCPFGAAIDDRVLGDPTWSIVQNPVVTLAPGPDGFEMPATPGIVHLVVPVQNLFDGTESTVDTDIDYRVGVVVEILDDDSISIRLR